MWDDNGGDDPTPLHENIRRMREGDEPTWASSDWHEKNGFTQVDNGVLTCMCGQRVADEIELRVHRHYDHAEAIAA